MSTRYVVLMNESGRNWILVDTVEGHSASDAIRRHGKEGTYVALPARSWRPVIVSTETKTVTRVKAASEAPQVPERQPEKVT